MTSLIRKIAAPLSRFRRPVRWVVLDEHFAVYDLAHTKRQLNRFVAELEAQGQEYTVENIGNRCTECGEDVAPFPLGADYPHAPECPHAD